MSRLATHDYILTARSEGVTITRRVRVVTNNPEATAEYLKGLMRAALRAEKARARELAEREAMRRQLTAYALAALLEGMPLSDLLEAEWVAA
jgi:hypothetical protein